MKAYKTVFYYSVMTGNRGDMAIRKSIVDTIKERINVPFAFFDLKYEELTEERILKQINTEGSVFIIAGSGLYSNYPNKSSGWYFPCKTSLFDKIKIPIALIGVGCNNNLKGTFCRGKLSVNAKNSIKKINDKAFISTVRDMNAFKLLSELQIKKHQLQLDPGNFLVSKDLIKENRIAINLAQHSKDLGRYDGDINFRNKTIQIFGKLINQLKITDCKTIFIAHDALEQSIIRDLQKIAPSLEWINTDNIDTMLYEYSRCKLSIGVRMHSNIMSLASNTPFISLYYDTKSIEYCKLLNNYPYLYSVFNNYESWLYNAIKEISQNNEQIKDNLQMIQKKYKQLFHNAINRICNIIKISN